MSIYRHILMATDLSDESREFLKHAKAIADAVGAKLSIIHVIEPLPVYAYSYIDSVGLEKQQVDDATQNLKTLGKEFKIPETQQILKVGHAKAEIIQYADETKIDLIVVGSHVHHGLAKLLGSTANAISHAAHCDVLVIRHTTTG